MGSESVATLILLIASLIAASMVAGTMIGSFSELSEVIDDRSDATVNQIETDVRIINDPDTNGTYNNSTNTLTLYVKNTGTRNLKNSTEVVDVFVDGTYVNVNNMTVKDADTWATGSVAELTINIDLASGYHRTKVVVNGDSETMEFYV